MTDASETLVELEGLEKSYRRGWFRNAPPALHSVTFRVRRGEVFGLLGPNGAGKTTIIKILLGIVRATGGTARLLGYPAGDQRGRRKVGYLPEHLQIPAHQTARTALEYYGRLSGMSHADIRRRSDELIPRVGLAGRCQESVKRFSKGMRQRLGLAQALLHQPDLVILDEPTDGLDPVGRSQVRSLLQQLRDEGRTVFLNSHLLQEVELVCDRVAILDKGHLKFVGRIDELTPPGQGRLELRLQGDETAIHRALAPWSEQLRLQVEPHFTTVQVPLDHQSAADRLVDSLRLEQISIAGLTWRRRTLEDAFLDMIGQELSTS